LKFNLGGLDDLCVRKMQHAKSAKAGEKNRRQESRRTRTLENVRYVAQAFQPAGDETFQSRFGLRPALARF